MKTSRSLIAFTFLLLAPATAGAGQLNVVMVGDLPGTQGHWQGGEVTVSAPPDVVQKWYSDAPQWPSIFPDVKSAKVLGRAPDGSEIIEYKSDIVGRTIQLNVRDSPGRIDYDGKGSGVTTQGHIFFYPAGPGQTRVVLQTTGEIHGVAGVFVGPEEKRERAIKKLKSDLETTTRLANQWAAENRR